MTITALGTVTVGSVDAPQTSSLLADPPWRIAANLSDADDAFAAEHDPQRQELSRPGRAAPRRARPLPSPGPRCPRVPSPPRPRHRAATDAARPRGTAEPASGARYGRPAEGQAQDQPPRAAARGGGQARAAGADERRDETR